MARLFFILAFTFTNFVIAEENHPEQERHLPDGSTVPLALKTHVLQLMPRGSINGFSAVEFKHEWKAPISKLQGDLIRLGMFRFDFYIAKYVSIKITGVVQEFLRIHGNPDLGQYDIQSNTAHDIGDVSIATVACIIPPKKHRPALGFRIETKLPNTNQDRGLGPNTTDIIISTLAAHRAGPVLVFGDVGIGILTAPRNLNEQNDVLVYGLGSIWRINSHLQLAWEVNGFLSTRPTIPVGTEDRGNLRFGLVWTLRKWTIELFPGYGLTKREGKFSLLVGLSWRLNLHTHD